MGQKSFQRAFVRREIAPPQTLEGSILLIVLNTENLALTLSLIKYKYEVRKKG